MEQSKDKKPFNFQDKKEYILFFFLFISDFLFFLNFLCFFIIHIKLTNSLFKKVNVIHMKLFIFQNLKTATKNKFPLLLKKHKMKNALI